jgi:hypothetical protein
MTSLNKRYAALLPLFLLCSAPLTVLISGCAKESKPSAADGYYTGPMQKKGDRPSNANPNLTKGGVKTE